jgi:hypothetical protein
MSEQLEREEIRRRVRERAGKPPLPAADNLPPANLLLADVITRIGSYWLRDGVEKAFLKQRYDADTARDAVDNRSGMRALAAFGLAKFATRSLPGAVIVGTGILGKVLFDHSKARRKKQQAKAAQLTAQSADDSNDPET